MLHFLQADDTLAAVWTSKNNQDLTCRLPSGERIGGRFTYTEGLETTGAVIPRLGQIFLDGPLGILLQTLRKIKHNKPH